MTMDHPDHLQPPPPVPGGLLDMIDRMMIEIENARQVPLSSSVMINQDEILDDLARIQAGLPDELRAARWMVREREAYIARTNEKARAVVADAKAHSESLVADATARSEAMIADATARSKALVAESYIVQEAVEEANTLVRNAETEARRIRLEAEDFAERHLAEAENVLGELLRYVREARAELHQTLPPQPEPPISG